MTPLTLSRRRKSAGNRKSTPIIGTMLTCKLDTDQAPGRTVHKSTQRLDKVPTENLKQKGNNITKKKQVQERVQSNDGPLYIKRLEPAAAFNALLTHRLYNQPMTLRLLGHSERTWARLLGLRVDLIATFAPTDHILDQSFSKNSQPYHF